MENTDRREANAEIDLVDVWLIIRRHRWLFVVVFAAVAVIGTAFAFLRAPLYTYSATLQIGALRNDRTGVMDPVMLPDSAVATLEHSIIPAVVREYVKQHPGFNPRLADIQVSTPRTGNVVIIETRGSLARAVMAKGLLTAVENSFIKNNNTLIQAYLEAARGFLTQQIDKLGGQINALEKTRQQLLVQGNRTDKLLTALLVDNQIGALQKQLMDLESKRDVDLLTDARPVEALGEPQRSLKLSGISLPAKVFLSLVLGVFAGLLAIFVAHLRSLAQKRSAQ